MTSSEAKFRSFPNKPFSVAQKERLEYTSEHLKDRDETYDYPEISKLRHPMQWLAVIRRNTSRSDIMTMPNSGARRFLYIDTHVQKL